MPGTPTSRGLTTLATSDVITSFATTINSVTTSVNTALVNTLQFYNYTAANTAARNAITGMVDGSLCFQTDTNEIWFYDTGATSWKILQRPETSFTSALGGVGGTTAQSQSGIYVVSGGICYAEVNYAITNTTNAFLSTATASAASGNGSIVTYTVSSHPFVAGQQVTVTGFSSTQYNLTSVTIVSTTSTTFTVSNGATGSSSGTGTVTSSYPIFTMPIAYGNYGNTPRRQIAGECSFFNSSTGASHSGTAMWMSATTVTPMFEGTNGLLSPPRTTTGNPLTEAWATDDRILLSFAYPV